MYTCTTKQDPFETYFLKHGSGQTYIEVVPERGGIISKYVQDGEQIFYLEQDTLEDVSKNIRGGNPILFPISSYLVDETYYYNDVAYQLKQHGFARNLPARVVSTHTDEASASIVLEIVSNEQTLARYPFNFKLTMKYVLDGDGLTVHATVFNLDQKVMPFYLGYHPYFYVPDKGKLTLNIPSNSWRELVPNSMQDEQFNFNQAESNVIFDDLQGYEYGFIDHTRHLKLTITSDEVYQHIVLWALDGKPFICIEPWMAPVNGMNVNKGIQYIQANEMNTSTVRIKAERLD